MDDHKYFIQFRTSGLGPMLRSGSSEKETCPSATSGRLPSGPPVQILLNAARIGARVRASHEKIRSRGKCFCVNRRKD